MFAAATTSREFRVMLQYVPDDFLLVNTNVVCQENNHDAGDRLHIEVKTFSFSNATHCNDILIRRSRFP
jgi:hypothetical protein